MSETDKLIQHYAEQIEMTIEEGTSVGTLTWRGLLGSFLIDAKNCDVSKQIELKVLVNLDPMPGTFSDEESARYIVQQILTQAIAHYNPVVLNSLDIAKEAK